MSIQSLRMESLSSLSCMWMLSYLLVVLLVYYWRQRCFCPQIDMKDLGEASFVLGIEIHRDISKGVLGLSQKAYIEKILKKFNTHKCSPSPTPLVKGDRCGDFQCPRNQYEIDQM